MTVDGTKARVVISGVTPEIDCGLYPIKRTIGQEVVVEADAFTDGPMMEPTCVLLHRQQGTEWQSVAMCPLGNDRWRGDFTPMEEGIHEYTFQAWINHFGSWRRDLQKRLNAGQDVAVEMLVAVTIWAATQHLHCNSWPAVRRFCRSRRQEPKWLIQAWRLVDALHGREVAAPAIVAKRRAWRRSAIPCLVGGAAGRKSARRGRR